MARPTRPAPRLHRLPQRLDYTLIPAPLDLSLPLVSEKSPLPAIIVTPSSPSDEHRFSIAFLAPPPPPTFKERISTLTSNLSSSSTFNLRARTAIILFLILFVMTCHLVAHKMAMDLRRPHLEFATDMGVSHSHPLHDSQSQQGLDLASWFGIEGEKRELEMDFIVDEA